MSPCPCGSSRLLADCCLPYIDGNVNATTAEALMRARYTAHVIGNMSFILKTHHPSTRTAIDEAATARWARESDWLELDIMKVTGGLADDSEGRIEFMAHYRDADKRRHTHHEVGVFEKYHGQWFFKDADMPRIEQFQRDTPKQGRNEPCGCGSGKKFKRCCGQAA